MQLQLAAPEVGQRKPDPLQTQLCVERDKQQMATAQATPATTTEQTTKNKQQTMQNAIEMQMQIAFATCCKCRVLFHAVCASNINKHENNAHH